MHLAQGIFCDLYWGPRTLLKSGMSESIRVVLVWMSETRATITLANSIVDRSERYVSAEPLSSHPKLQHVGKSGDCVLLHSQGTYSFAIAPDSSAPSAPFSGSAAALARNSPHWQQYIQIMGGRPIQPPV